MTAPIKTKVRAARRTPVRKLGKEPKTKRKTLADVRTALTDPGVGHRAAGRPLRPYDPAVADDIVARLHLGLPLKTAAAGRASYDVLLRWMGDEEHFAVALQKGEADEQLRLLQSMETAPAGRWQVFAWKLERMWPHLYGQKAELRVEKVHKHEVNAEMCDEIGASFAAFMLAQQAIPPAQPTPLIDA
tara:strand:- start:352 stop:915 length:564 start_codon:yes stop_codon:yes gene_type:complete